MRKTIEDTWRQLEAEGDRPPRHSDGRPVVPDRMPSCDDEEPLGLAYYKTRLMDADRSSLRMPRTYFGRSGFYRVRFADTDLSDSRMCWNDFEDCDFSGADLSGCDMRASKFDRCRFVGASLRVADLRRSSFEDCDFSEADMTGAVAEGEDADGCVQDWLTDEQQTVMAWAEDEGPVPPGG